jgi:hypothetical protein
VNTSGFGSEIKNIFTGQPNLDVVQGMFYARASWTASPFAEMVARDKEIRRASLGLKNIESFSRPVVSPPFKRVIRRESGVLIREFELQPASPLKLAGMMEGDLIIGIQSQDRPLNAHLTEIHAVGDLNNALAFFKPGNDITIRYRRFSADWLDRYLKRSLHPLETLEELPDTYTTRVRPLQP